MKSSYAKELHKATTILLNTLMVLGEPFEFDSDLICADELFDECLCPNCIYKSVKGEIWVSHFYTIQSYTKF